MEDGHRDDFLARDTEGSQDGEEIEAWDPATSGRRRIEGIGEYLSDRHGEVVGSATAASRAASARVAAASVVSTTRSMDEIEGIEPRVAETGVRRCARDRRWGPRRARARRSRPGRPRAARRARSAAAGRTDEAALRAGAGAGSDADPVGLTSGSSSSGRLEHERGRVDEQRHLSPGDPLQQARDRGRDRPADRCRPGRGRRTARAGGARPAGGARRPGSRAGPSRAATRPRCRGRPSPGRG